MERSLKFLTKPINQDASVRYFAHGVATADTRPKPDTHPAPNSPC
jgi:hypothetical protein